MSFFKPHYLSVIISRTYDKDGYHSVILFDKTIREDILGEKVDSHIAGFINSGHYVKFHRKNDNLRVTLDVVKRINSMESSGIKVDKSQPGLAYLLVNPEIFTNFRQRDTTPNNGTKTLLDRIAYLCL